MHLLVAWIFAIAGGMYFLLVKLMVLGDTGDIDEQSVPKPPDRFDRT